jgi:hypothetical protein
LQFTQEEGSMKRTGAVLLGIAAFAAIPALADDGGNRFGGNLTGYQETPATLSTTGHGRFDLLIDDRGGEVHWQLSYADLESAVTQAHIHLGRRATSGGISVFLCSNLANPPAGTQACPPFPATISGTFTAVDVIGPAGQGIAPGEFEELLRAIRSGSTYANVHTVGRPSGEIRAQIRRGHSNGSRDRD